MPSAWEASVPPSQSAQMKESDQVTPGPSVRANATWVAVLSLPASSSPKR